MTVYFTKRVPRRHKSRILRAVYLSILLIKVNKGKYVKHIMLFCYELKVKINVPNVLKADIYSSYRRNSMLMLGKQSGKINGILKRQLRKQKKRLQVLQC
jgi:hypothetical protein